ncbi:MAG: sugar ABC transporter ATP-binding protein [Rhodospirillales bacterium]
MTNITKRFGSVTALNDIDFDLLQGEIHALLGVNGAGKSTLVKIISGLYTPDAGQILVDDKPRTIASPRDAINAGIATVQQHPELVGDLSGYENIFLGQESQRPGLFRAVDRVSMRARADSLLERFPIEIDLSKPVRDMESVERETVAILHALKQDHIKVLILDEPTSTLTHREADQLFEVMRTLKDSGIGIVYITHRLEEVLEIADRFTVFRDGKSVATLDAKSGEYDEAAITTLMLQQDLAALYPAKAEALDAAVEPLLEVRDLTVEGAFHDFNLQLKPGEIVGGFGLVGSGIEALAMTLFGATAPTAGEIRLQGQPVKLSSPGDALRRGIFLVPGDRKTEGLTLSRDVTFNATLANLGRASFLGGLLRFRRNDSVVGKLLEQLDLRPPQLWRKAREFSGGNQQKVVLAKGLYRQARVYILVEPTVGVDIGAKSKLYALIRELSQSAGVLVLSSDFDELYGVADRVFSLYRGRVSIQPARGVSRDRLLTGGLVGSVQ